MLQAQQEMEKFFLKMQKNKQVDPPEIGVDFAYPPLGGILKNIKQNKNRL